LISQSRGLGDVYKRQLLREALDALHSTGLMHTHTLAALAERVVNRNT
jgi:hypothetical protein